MDELKIEQNEQEHVMLRIESGQSPQEQRPKYRKEEKRILQLVKKHSTAIHDGSYLPYLKVIAHNVRF